MPAVNSIISQADYNSIRTKVASVIGTGAADYGWGQTLLSTAVSNGSKVTINEWGKLRYDIINAYTHITGSTPTTVVTTDGSLIRYNTSFTPDTGTNDVAPYQYNVWADTIVANRFTVHSTQSSTTASTTPSTFTGTWNSRLSCVIDVYWTTSEQARFFFNSGGQVRVASAQSGGSGTAQNSSWRSLLSSIGSPSFGGNNPGTGTTPNTGTNWFRLTNSFQQYYSASASSPYGSNRFILEARTTDVISNSLGTSKSMQIRVTWNDGHVGLGGGPDYVDGTFQVTSSLLYATGILVPTGTGNFTVTLPTIAVGGIS